MASVSLHGVGKLYGTVRALEAVDLQVGDGEFLVLVGPSGCGKSTLLRMIAGLEEISEGELQIAGERANDKAPRDRDVAMVFQSYALYPHMSGRRNMGFGLEVRKVPAEEIEQRVGDAARMLEIEGLLDRLPKDMSGGQRQRIAMGRAIVRNPKVFLFDEPLSNLDASLRSQMRAELKQLHARLGTTMIYVTHDQVEAMTLADRICVLRDGVLQQVGSPEELFERPANRFVAGFIGSPSMNFLPARLEEDRLVGEGFSVPAPSGLEVSELLLGIRPHDLVLSSSGGIEGCVALVEPMGWEAHVHVQVGEERLLVRVESSQLDELGPCSGIRLAAQQQHLFSACSAGERL
ncbi:MAG: sn-glycerol-3-phosphate ABC transporter ATP-binding protein UgpC [Myxococcota bacterium]|nr:sn-glycerol-3-phosphate ABC transporter ATP-binding protein UgpC [Myxococcota bacterium]